MKLSLLFSVLGSHTKKKRVKKHKMHLIFDLDNTLYSFDDSGVNEAVFTNIIHHVSEKLHITPEEAGQLSERYNKEYGISLTGFAVKDGLDPIEFCDATVMTLDLENRLHPDNKLFDALRQLEARGLKLWIMTSADPRHAERALRLLGLSDFFKGRVIDIFQTWARTKPIHGAPINKPFIEAYRIMESIIGASGSDCVMVEDSMVNLVAPRQLGWRTVWVSQGRPTPADSCADYVISSAKDMIGVMEKIAAGSAKAPKRNSEQAGVACVS